MKLSWNWLNEFIDLNEYTPENISAILTMKTCEAEGVHSFLPYLSHIYVCQIKQIDKHPNADKLKVCSVFDGKETLTIVTGASNVEVNKKYPLSKVGSILANGFKIEASKLRGIDSYGMLCSANEIGLDDFLFPIAKVDGLLELPENLDVGITLDKALNIQSDFIIDIDNKSITHRPDLWSHFGFARELASLLNKKLKLNPIENANKKIQNNKLHTEKSDLEITIQDNVAITYSSSTIENIEFNQVSPFKNQARLISVGMRPINNIVDASNYVMLELGLPTHAFDKNTLNKNITISFSKQNEKIITLDSKEHALPENIVLIRTNNEQPVAIAGIMGGKNSEISSQSTTIFFESACFHRKYIRRAVSKLGIRSEASQRFEKGQDPNLTEPAIVRFLEVLLETSPNAKLNGIFTKKTEEYKNNVIKTSFSYLKSRLGDINLSNQEIVSTLTSLQMECQANQDELIIKVPSHRSYFDIEIPEDLTEELGRIIGYKTITPVPFLTKCHIPEVKNNKRIIEHQLRNLLSNSYHFMEVYNYCFHSEKDIITDTRYEKKPVELMNPIQSDLKFMRVSPLIGLLKNIADNQTQKKEIRIFEIEKIFIRQLNTESLPKYKQSLCDEVNFMSGAIISDQNPELILLSISSLLDDILLKLGLPKKIYKRDFLEEDIFHPGRGGILHNKTPLFKWGEIHPKICNEYFIDKRVFYFETFIDNLLTIDSNQCNYKPVAKYPSSDFEITLVTDKLLPFKNLENIILNHIQDFSEITCEDIQYLSTYTGDSIDKNKKAISLKITWQNQNKTIEHDVIKQLQNSLIASFAKEGIPLR